MSRSKEYVINTVILFIGKFVTQFMSFLLLPLYTHYLLTSDYGIVDMIQTYISLFVPVLTLRFDSAVFRFLIDERENEEGQKKIITNILISLLAQIIVFAVLFIIIVFFVKFDYYMLIMINIPAIMISNILLQLVRGLGKNKEYSISCIITGIITLIINCVLIVGLKANAGSILIASTIANIICSIYLIIRTNLLKYINIKLFDKEKIKELLKYSVPMISNALSWWIVNVSDRTIITWIMGAAANGIYSVSCKFSNILNSVFQIFNMSWQETASVHINDEDRDVFFTNMINKILLFFISISLLILGFLPLAFNIIIGKDYYLAYIYIPILLLANIFNVFMNLIGGIYLAKKQTKKLSNTTIVSAIINLVLNLMFIKKLGLYSAALSTLFAYLASVVYRYKDVQKYVKFKLDFQKFFGSIGMFLIVTISYYINNVALNVVAMISVCVFVVIMNKYLINAGIRYLKKLKERKK